MVGQFWAVIKIFLKNPSYRFYLLSFLQTNGKIPEKSNDKILSQTGNSILYPKMSKVWFFGNNQSCTKNLRKSLLFPSKWHKKLWITSLWPKYEFSTESITFTHSLMCHQVQFLILGTKSPIYPTFGIIRIFQK